MWPTDRDPVRPARRLVPGLSLGAAVGVLALVGAACGSGGGGSGGGSTSTTAPPATSAAGASSTASGPSTSVTASLSEYKITLSQQNFAAGSYTFVVTNTGTITHALEINGPGVSDQSTGGLEPGQHANLTVTLQAGSYDLFCPVDGHKKLGMDLNLTVSAGSGVNPGGPTSASMNMTSMTNMPATTATNPGGGYGYGG